MDAVILIVALAALAAFVAAPLYKAVRPIRPDERSELEARRDATFTALRELELDRTTSLVGEEEYRRQREALEREAAKALRRLEEAD